MSISSAPELELSLVSFLDQAPLQLDREGMKAREDGEMGGGVGDYSRDGFYSRTVLFRSHG